VADGERRKPAWTQYYSASAIGLEVGVALAIGMGIGWWLDRVFHTRPWLLVIFTGFGIVAGFRNLIRSAEKTMRDVEGDGKRDDPPAR
jgi:ATP synthase protein I